MPQMVEKDWHKGPAREAGLVATLRQLHQLISLTHSPIQNLLTQVSQPYQLLTSRPLVSPQANRSQRHIWDRTRLAEQRGRQSRRCCASLATAWQGGVGLSILHSTIHLLPVKLRRSCSFRSPCSSVRHHTSFFNIHALNVQAGSQQELHLPLG